MALTDKNLYAYCDNNPVMRTDFVGALWESIWDAVSLLISADEVADNPTDFWAWAGLVGDVVDVAIPFVGGIGESIRAIRTVDKVASAIDTTYDMVKVADRAGDVTSSFTNGIRYTDKVLRQMNNPFDLNHSFPSIIDTFVDINSGRPLKGGDGIVRTIIELPGSINDRPGVFEYVIEPNGMCNHRYFRNLR